MFSEPATFERYVSAKAESLFIGDSFGVAQSALGLCLPP